MCPLLFRAFFEGLIFRTSFRAVGARMRTLASRARVRTGFADMIVSYGEVAPAVPALFLARWLAPAIAGKFPPFAPLLVGRVLLTLVPPSQ